GDWPTGGESNADALAMAAEQANLLRQRELLEETLAEVNDKLAKMEAGELPGIGENEAEAQSEAEAAPRSDLDTTPTFTPGDVEEEITETPAEEAAEPEPLPVP
ncbi:MAG: hypothetical protein AAGL98_02110, partial [Planctomycetota bacterium]